MVRDSQAYRKMDVTRERISQLQDTTEDMTTATAATTTTTSNYSVLFWDRVTVMKHNGTHSCPLSVDWHWQCGSRKNLSHQTFL